MASGALTFMLFACGQGQTTTPQTATQESLRIDTTTTHFTQGNNIELQLKVSSPNDSTIDIGITAPPEVQLQEKRLQIALVAGETKIFTIQAKLLQPGFFAITTSATSKNWQDIASDHLGFNVEESANTRSAPLATRAANLNPTGVESLEDHVKNLPIVTDQSIHLEQVKADLENRRNVRNDYILKDASFKRPDGSNTPPQNMVIGYLRGTGSGQPLPGELDGVKPQGSPTTTNRSTRTFCGTRTATVHFDIKHPGNLFSALKNVVFPLNGYYVKVMDDNGIWGSDVVAEGLLDGNGTFEYQQPICDKASPWWGDYSPPDIFYYLEARIPNTPTSSYHQAIRIVDAYGNQNFIQTGTMWEDSTTTHNYSLDATTVWQNHFLWLAKMFQFAQDFNVAAGGTKIGFGVFWPANFANGTGAYAPVARVVLGGGDALNPRSLNWEYPSPAVHEFGHLLRYSVSNPTWYSNCLGSFLPCDPGFGEGVLGIDYNHSVNTLTTPAKAFNEGFADYFYEMTRDYYEGIGKNYIPNNFSYYTRDCDTSCIADPSANNEAHVSSFLYQYTTKMVATVGLRSNTAAFGIVRDSIKDTSVYNQGLYDVWNNFAKRSYTSLNANYPNPCANNTLATKTVVFSCYLTRMTLNPQAVTLP